MASHSLPVHQYVYVDQTFTRKDKQGFEPAVWFGLSAVPGRAWGCHVMLECGAVYRGLPAHALSYNQVPLAWTLQQSQLWDCYGYDFQLLEYTYLRELRCLVSVQKQSYEGTYLFTAVPLDDSYTRKPSQSKEFMFIKLDNNRITIQPTNKILFKDKSFTVDTDWPTDLKLSETVWVSEK